MLRRVSPEFPAQVASVIQKTYPNPQVVQMISSQIDADRMDYLLRDAYHTGTKYGTFDLTRILRVMRPYKDGICFEISGMHAVEDYIVSRFQMYQQIYFHPVSRSMEVILNHLLKRAKEDYESASNRNEPAAPYLLFPFFNHEFNLEDYLLLDDGTLTTYFAHWRQSSDPILADLAHRFLDRKPLKSVKFDEKTKSLIPELRQLIEKAGFNSTYYTAINDSYDLPYDAYEKPTAQIELMQADGQLIELSTVSALVNAISGKFSGDQRFFFPKEMLSSKQDNVELFDPIYKAFQTHLHNDYII